MPSDGGDEIGPFFGPENNPALVPQVRDPQQNPGGEEDRRPPPGGAVDHRPGQDPHPDPRPNQVQDPAPGQQPAVQPEAAAQLRTKKKTSPTPSNPLPTPEQLKEAETLLDNPKQWFKDLNRPTDKKFRRQVTEMAHSIIFTSKHDAKDAFDMALFHVDLRPQIQKAGKEKESSPSKKSKSKRSKDKSKSKKKLKPQDSSDTESSSGSSSSSPCSDSSDSDSTSDEDDPKWKPGRANMHLWGALNVPDRIAKKVDNGKFVNMWWFAPAALSMKHKEKKRSLTLQGGEFRSAEPTKPLEFVEDGTDPVGRLANGYIPSTNGSRP
ncbi:hypothetical protein A4X06_0g1985 [Tilletia controversa]|uniref:Uncharacterized protein n=1 Tax=Tilletia controversa TaxID=13291 RepID=A0A8X7SZL0_9BASI|nr:hypothetical protein A4X06_0g1985 [Tilletia controversa]